MRAGGEKLRTAESAAPCGTMARVWSKLGGVVVLLAVSVMLSAQPIDLDDARAAEEFRWGVTAYHLAQFGDAVLSFERALAFQPESTTTRHWLGRAYYRAGFVDLAIDQWRIALADGRPAAAEDADADAVDLGAAVAGRAIVEQLLAVAELRRGVGAELRPPAQYIPSHELDANQPTAYPFRRPSAVVARDDGGAYVVAFGSDEIVELDVNGAARRTLRGGLNGLQSPFDVLEVDGQLFVSEYGANRIARLAGDGTVVDTVGERGRGPGQLLGPQYLAADSDGFIYVTDWGNRRVVKFHASGRHVLSFGGRDGAFGGLQGPSGIQVIGDEVFVADRSRPSLEVFDRSGNHLRTVSDPSLQAPEGLAAMGGNLLVADTTRLLAVDVLREAWQELPGTDQLGGKLLDVAVSANDDLLVVDFDDSTLHTLSDVDRVTGGLAVAITRVDASAFPEVVMELSVEDRYGQPILGLTGDNFVLSENRIPLGSAELLASPASRRGAARVAILVESSPRMRQLAPAVQAVLDELAGALPGNDPIDVISVGADPVEEGNARDRSLRVAPFLDRRSSTARWQLDRGLRLGVARLLPSRQTRALIFLGTGRLRDDAFESFHLGSAAAYLSNNQVAFYPIALDRGQSPELGFLAERSGGRQFDALGPTGVREVAAAIVERLVPAYILRYGSHLDPGFGLRYLPTEAEVSMRGASGRDEVGYFAPRTFER